LPTPWNGIAGLPLTSVGTRRPSAFLVSFTRGVLSLMAWVGGSYGSW
jgi:hypothetical protein